MKDEEFVFTPIHATVLVERDDGNFNEARVVPACDFCLDSRIEWDYPCEEFTLEIPGFPTFGSTGDWAACQRCSALIEQGAFGNLAVRSIRSWLARHGTIDEQQINSIGMIQRGFLDHRTGPRERATT